MSARKKDPTTRARRNKASTQATLTRPDPATTTAEAYAGLTIRQLRTEVDRRNADGRPDDQHLSKGGSKAAIVERLLEDDAPSRDIPPMPQAPKGEWHPQTVEWWDAVWSSPMSDQWDASDLHNVYVVALLVEDIWTATSAKARKDALSEYRLQRADLGLSPYSRRRLEWTIETAEEAKARGDRRRGNGSTPAPAPAGDGRATDPRLSLVT